MPVTFLSCFTRTVYQNDSLISDKAFYNVSRTETPQGRAALLAGMKDEAPLLANHEMPTPNAAARRAESANRLLVSANGTTRAGTDGVNIWNHLPQGCDLREVIERAANGQPDSFDV